jgi:hypothetical protein
MTMRWLSYCSCVVGLMGTTRADIVVGSGGHAHGAISFYEDHRFGQTFTATTAEPDVGMVSFRWWAVNLESRDPTVTVRLRQGSGYTGAVLTTQSRTIPDNTPDESWVDFIFAAPPALQPGQIYTLEFVVPPDSSGGYRHVYPNVYVDGTMLDEHGSSWLLNDLYFRVLAGSSSGSCYPNCDSSTGTPRLTANDFICFMAKFAAGAGYANCDGSTGSPVLTANDFVCFINAYAGGCL